MNILIKLKIFDPDVIKASIKNNQTVDELLLSTIPDKIGIKLQQEIILDNYFMDLEPILEYMTPNL